MKNTRFGIEIEMVMNRNTAAKVIANYFGTLPYFEGGFYQEYSVKDRQNRTWKVMYDGSIKTGGNDFTSCELVTPPLNYGDIEDLQQIVRNLRKAGAKVNSSCGIHIHVDAAKHNTKSIKNLFNIVYAKDDLLQRSLDIPFERMRFCKKIKAELLEGINKAQSIDQILDAWYKDFDNRSGRVYQRSAKYNPSRYHMINLHCLPRIGTIEFRLFNGTLHAGEIKSYIQFCLAVSAQAIRQKRAAKQKTTEIINHNNEKYTFRTWMLRLQLKGKEFETCRHHMLKRLNGNTAGNSVLRQLAI